MEIPKEITPLVGKAYFVFNDKTQETAVCTITRGVWHVANTGKFFAYEQNATIEGEAFKCVECGAYCFYPIRGVCQTCLDIFAAD